MNKQILGHGKKYLKNYMTGEFLFRSCLALCDILVKKGSAQLMVGP
jgi:hypothetical protein